MGGAQAGGGWRLGAGIWAVVCVLAIVSWQRLTSAFPSDPPSHRPAARVASALGELKSDFKAEELVDLLNKAIINFHTAESAVPKDAEALLKSAAEWIKKLPADIKLEISGHTDNVGDAQANQALSQRRADSIRSFLASAGVKRTAIQAKGYGDTKPVASNDTPEGRFQNRRIEYHVVK